MERRTKQREGWLRGKYPEVHSKTVDLITHTIDNGTLYFTFRFADQTSFCVRYACDMFAGSSSGLKYSMASKEGK